MEKNLSDLTDLKNKNRSQIDRLNDQVDQLNKICEDQDLNLKNLEFEKNKLQKKFDDLMFENNSNISKLKSKEEMLIFNKGQLEEANRNISKLQVKKI